VRASDIAEGFFTEGNEENEASNFQPQKNLLATFVSFCWTESGGALSMAPSTMASQSSALHDQAINCRSALCHSFVVPVYPPWRVICSSLVCIRVHSWLKNQKMMLTNFMPFG
jgi:hypothetical protein